MSHPTWLMKRSDFTNLKLDLSVCDLVRSLVKRIAVIKWSEILCVWAHVWREFLSIDGYDSKIFCLTHDVGIELLEISGISFS